ncbi:hypothetical protein [Mycolicibacterium arenosum]|uniref:Aldehyde dehydrogenase n=1 Tax=Mycolicibacterium arenosum TaxID=2952157 RepID=A0ABT1M549_9MYCO|nr:hypothetical protein [Mycolicibacterium sp. CAU 1645]MCP9273937.1 hypothetical protein [Mycolicibacterium sp. CAU 1645]
MSSQINTHQRNLVDRHRAIQHAQSLWQDSAARRFLDVLDEFDAEDRAYGAALSELNATFDEAEKLLGPS